MRSQATIILWALVVISRSATAQVTVGKNVQISTAHATMSLFEPSGSASPVDPNRLIACVTASSATHADRMNMVTYLSTDGGLTWTPTMTGNTFNYGVDAACAFAPDGDVYLTGIWRGPNVTGNLIMRSRDGGKQWQAIDTVRGMHTGYFGFYKRPDGGTTVTLTGGNDVPTSVRTGFSSITGSALIISTDGSHFAPWPLILSPDKYRFFGTANHAILSDGTVVMPQVLIRDRNFDPEGRLETLTQETAFETAAPGLPNAVLQFFTGNVPGRAWSVGAIISDVYWPAAEFATTRQPSIAVDASSGPFRDRIYVAWTDTRSGGVQIVISYSADRGKSWSRPRVIDESDIVGTRGKRDNLLPTLAVNKDGVVGIVWYDRRDYPDNLGWSVRFRASLDGGETWTSSVRVSEQGASFDKLERLSFTTKLPFVGETGLRAQQSSADLGISIDHYSYMSGDYIGFAAAADGSFHPMWIDNRTSRPQLWTARVSVKGIAARNGGGALASFDDLTERTAVEYDTPVYDSKTNTVRVNGRVRNTSDKPVCGPLTLRVLNVGSQIGVAQLVTAGSARSEEGIAVPLASSGAGKRIEPKAYSDPFQLTFKLSAMRPLREGRTLRFGLVDMSAKLLGPSGCSTS
jgi:hypothetical protein